VVMEEWKVWKGSRAVDGDKIGDKIRAVLECEVVWMSRYLFPTVCDVGQRFDTAQLTNFMLP